MSADPPPRAIWSLCWPLLALGLAPRVLLYACSCDTPFDLARCVYVLAIGGLLDAVAYAPPLAPAILGLTLFSMRPDRRAVALAIAGVLAVQVTPCVWAQDLAGRIGALVALAPSVLLLGSWLAGWALARPRARRARLPPRTGSTRRRHARGAERTAERGRAPRRRHGPRGEPGLGIRRRPWRRRSPTHAGVRPLVSRGPSAREPDREREPHRARAGRRAVPVRAVAGRLDHEALAACGGGDRRARVRESRPRDRVPCGDAGTFDGMAPFMSKNGWASFTEERDYPPGCFTTAWGVADEHIFAALLERQIAALAAGRRFFGTVMSVSNHRPYLVPQGRTALADRKPSRQGAVSYADWALGRWSSTARDAGSWSTRWCSWWATTGRACRGAS